VILRIIIASDAHNSLRKLIVSEPRPTHHLFKANLRLSQNYPCPRWERHAISIL